ncbi:MAG: hydroxyethylthiazole kinase-like uncharacterized protein yjeF [Candidatus Paceibacteria bacterium]|jgi:hydroxyethylthiazole kinase-like uncharacterized protein yjeF
MPSAANVPTPTLVGTASSHWGERGDASHLPCLTRAQVRELDRYTISELGLPAVVLMENAGQALSHAMQQVLPLAAPLVVLCGRGNNGGDGYVLARCLFEKGYKPTLLETASPEELAPDAATFRGVTVALGLPRQRVLAGPGLDAWLGALPPQSAVVDALLGTGFQGSLREPLPALLTSVGQAAKRWGAQVLAVDVPSGLDVDSGQHGRECLAADITFTLAATKPGLFAEVAGDLCGRVVALPIGIPAAAYQWVQSLAPGAPRD